MVVVRAVDGSRKEMVVGLIIDGIKETQIELNAKEWC